REQHDRDVFRALIAAQAPREGEPRNAGQHPIEEDEVGARLAHQRLGLGYIAGGHHAIPGALQVGGQEVADRCFVFDYENGTAHGVSRCVVRRTELRGSPEGGISPPPYLTVVSYWPAVVIHRQTARNRGCSR